MKQKAKATIFSVARYITEKLGEVTTVKLQKLCYYSQAWYYVWHDVPLFDEDFEAWAGGPVCRELFKEHQGEFVVNAKDFAGEEELDESVREDVDKVLAYYAPHDGWWLSQLTHEEDPWRDTRQEAGAKPGDRCSAVIDKEQIREYYAGICSDE